MTVAAFLVALAVLWVGLLLWTRSENRRQGRQPGFRSSFRTADKAAEELWLGKLMILTRGNQGAIERAVMARRRESPQATRAELLERVYYEYLQDRGRN